MRKRLIDVSSLNSIQRRVENLAPPAKLPGGRFEIKNAASETADIYIYGDIAWYDITANMVADALNSLDAKTIRVHLNSAGGDVFDGVAIYNLLAQSSAKIEMRIDALAASIASVIAMAGDEIIIAENAMMMIHRAYAGVIGDAADMLAMANVLEMIENSQIIPVYKARTKLSTAALRDMIDAETWMDAKTCVEKGFASSIAPLSGAKAQVRAGQYAKTPKELGGGVAGKGDVSTQSTRARHRAVALSIEIEDQNSPTALARARHRRLLAEVGN